MVVAARAGLHARQSIRYVTGDYIVGAVGLVGSVIIVVVDIIVVDVYIQGMATKHSADRNTKWNASDIGDQRGRTAVVTGANSGLGIATVDAFAGPAPMSSSPVPGP